MAEIILISSSEGVQTTIQAVLGGQQHHVSVYDQPERLPKADVVIADLSGTDLDDPSTNALLARAPRALVLLERDCPVPVGVQETSQFAILRKPFDSFELSLKISALLRARAAEPSSRPSSPGADGLDRWLEFPFVPAPAGALLRRAAVMAAPLWIMGEPGSGRRRIAAAVAGRSQPSLGLENWYGDEPLEDALARASERQSALYVEAVDERSLADQARLAAAVDTGLPTKLIVTSVLDPASAVVEGRFSRELYHALSALIVQVSPLRERPAAIAPLVQLITAGVAESLGGKAVTYSAEAMARLQAYMWPGNYVELEAVINRTLFSLPRLNTDGRVIAPAELRFVADVDTGPAAEPPAQPARVAEAPAKAEIEGSGALEHVLSGLAHDLRNPMVAIKTFAGLLSDAEAQPDSSKELGMLARDACDRVESYLETLLEYGHMTEPSPTKVDVGDLLRTVVGSLDPGLGKRVKLEVTGALPVKVDRDQIRFALDNLLEAAVSDLGESGSVRITTTSGGTVLWTIETEHGPGSQLRDMSEDGEKSPTWRVLLARTLTERNGGKLEMHSTSTTTTLKWRLPVMEEEGAHGKQTDRTHR